MELEEFEAWVCRCWASIPSQFRIGITALVVESDVEFDGEVDDAWILGTCAPDEALMALPDAEVCSIITLYYGSFVLAAEASEDFDWREEIWETVRHELQHHLEWRAGRDDLGEEEDVAAENLRRLAGRPFVTDFHRRGTPVGSGAYMVESGLFVEVPCGSDDWSEVFARGVRTRWGSLDLVAALADVEPTSPWVCYAPAEVVEHSQGPEDCVPWTDVTLVLRRRRRWFDFWS